jgi:hypothetical protein
MILPTRGNRSFKDYFQNLRSEPYLKINLVLAGIVLLIFVYSGIFSPDKGNYPVVCIHEKITGQQCASCGLSHSFSLILRGRFNEAVTWNPYGIRIFLFFLAQLLLRFAFSIYYISKSTTRKELIIFDISGSIVIFFLAFWPLFSQLIFSLSH